MKHTNEIARQVLREEFSDYKGNQWHYNRQYKLIVKALDLQKKMKTELENAIDVLKKTILPIPCVLKCECGETKELIIICDNCLDEHVRKGS